MILCLGLNYKNVLEGNSLEFAKQIGAQGIVVHLIDYQGINLSLPGLKSSNTALYTNGNHELWEVKKLKKLKSKIESNGLHFSAIENFDPGSWHDILLDGPKKNIQIEYIKQCIRNAGEAGIPVIHYNFSIAGIWGWYKGPFARGGAVSIGFDTERIDINEPIPKGMVWNMFYDSNVSQRGGEKSVNEIEIWSRVDNFLNEVIPVAEKSGVALAAHPDDPPLSSLRQTARLINRTSKYKQLIDLCPNPSNGINFCLGTTQEMPDHDLYETLSDLLARDVIKIVHFRNVKGKIPRYYEVFPDEGDIDMRRIVKLLQKYNYQGIMMPDHTPEVACGAPWHAGMAYTMGYIKGLLQE